jgi:hypothetical protein
MAIFYAVVAMLLVIYAIWMVFFPLVICNKMDKIIKILSEK